MAEIGKLWVTIEARSEDLLKGLEKAQAQISNTAKSAEKIGKTISGVGRTFTIAGAAITGAMGLAVNSFVTAGDAVAKMSKRTGIGTTALQELGFVAERSGTNLSAVEVSVKRMSRVINDAEQGLSTAVRSLESLNLTIEELQNLSPEEQFTKLSEAIASVENPTKRAALAQEIFGRSGTQLLPMLSEGAEGLRNMRKEAHLYANVMDEATVAAAENLNDRMGDLKASFTAIVQTVAVAVLPTVLDFIKKAQDLAISVRAWVKENQELFNTISKVVLIAGAVLAVLGPTLLILGQLIAAMGSVKVAVAAVIGTMKLLGGSLLALNPPIAIITAAVIALGAVWYKTFSDAAQATRDLDRATIGALNKQSEIKKRVDEGVAVWKQYGDTSAASLLKNKITADEAKRAMEGLFILASQVHGEERQKWNERALLYKSVYKTLVEQAQSARKATSAMSQEEMEEIAEYETAKMEALERIAEMEMSRLQSLEGKIRQGLENKKMMLEEERLFAIENASMMGLEIDQINEFYAQKERERRFAAWQEALSMSKNILGQISAIYAQHFQNRSLEIDNWEKQHKDALAASGASEEALAAGTKAIEEEAARRRKQLLHEKARQEKDMALMSATVNTAAAVVQALATGGPIVGPILAGIVGALGAVQIAMIAAQPLPALAQGGLAFGPTMAMVGDNMNASVNPEVIAPLSDLDRVIGSKSQTINIYLDGRVIAQAAAENMPEILSLHGAAAV